MTTTALVSIAVLALIVVLAAIGRADLGGLALVGSFMVGGLLAGESTKDILADFPADLFVMLVGVTYLFGLARANGTVDLLVHGTFRAVRGKAALLPWVFFGLSTVLCGVGGNPAAVAAILLPVGMTVAASHGVAPLVVAITVGMGSTAGTFSPLGVLGITIRGVQETNGLPTDPGLLFGATLLAGVVAAGVATMLPRIRKLHDVEPSPAEMVLLASSKAPASPTMPASSSSAATAPTSERGGPDAGGEEDTGTSTSRVERVATSVAVLALVVGALVLGLDVGFLALTAAIALTLIWPRRGREAFSQISWGVLLLLTGIVTFVGVLDRNGTIAWAGEVVASMQPALLAALMICVIGAVTSAFASTLGMMVALVPITIPLISTGQVSAAGLVVALGISASLVDVSPFSTCGALAMANASADGRGAIYRGLLGFAATVAVLGPLLSWAILVASGWF